MDNGKSKEGDDKGNRPKTVGEWARAVESIAKAAVAVVGLAVLILVEIIKNRKK